MDDASIAELLPLKSDVFTILLVLLEEGDLHGYGIMKAAEARDAEGGELQPGALYRLLRQMLDAGMIEEVDEEEIPPERDRRRRTYRITGFGREVASAEARRMAELVRVSRRHDLLEKGERA